MNTGRGATTRPTRPSRVWIVSCPTLVLTASTVCLACGPSSGEQLESVEPGTLEFASLSEFEGARYSLEATLDVSGPSSFVVETGPSRRLIGRSLGPGTYRLVIWPHPQVFVDEIVAQVPVNCELASDQTRPFEISSGAATRLAFEFAMPSGRLSFQPE